jgi:riboflavin transporter FmnP
MAAMSSAVYYFLPEIPIIPGVDYLKIDISDLPALVGAITLGPLSAIFIEFIKNLIHLMKSTTLGIGDLCNFLVGVSFTVPFGLLFSYFKKHDNNKYKTFIFTAAISVLSIVFFGLLVNAAFVPLFFKVFKTPFNKTVYLSYVFSSIPLNIVKGVINSILVIPIIIALNNNKFFQYKKIS